MVSKLDNLDKTGIQIIDDYTAEKCSGGAFLVSTGDGTSTLYIGETIVELEGATRLGLENADLGFENPDADGHNFLVTFTNRAGRVVGREDVVYGTGIQNFNRYIENGAVTAEVDQYSVCLTDEGRSTRGSLC